MKNNVRQTFPRKYRSFLNYKETVGALIFLKDFFQYSFAKKLNIVRVPAPLALLANTGINDYQNSHIPIVFDVLDVGKKAEIVRSLAKWKRLTLSDYGYKLGEGLYTDMNAIRQDESLDNTHSMYVDQWDWERVMSKSDRNLNFLKKVSADIYRVIRDTEKETCKKYRKLPGPILPKDIYFIHSEDLEKRYPDLSPGERENEICKEEGAVFLIGIGSRKGESRSVDHDDWSTETSKGKVGLNGDILVWHPVISSAVELSSMGIRTNGETLLRQLKIKNEMERAKLYYHKRVVIGDIAQTIGGGIGKSRLNMFFLRKAHIGEVQVSIWPEKMTEDLARKNIKILS
jgi:aspartate--ammonia ligase